MNENENPWIVRAPKQYEQVPNGVYMAAFKDIEDYDLRGKLKWRFSWEVRSGAQAGKAATALCNRTIDPKVETGRLIAGLLGREIVDGENVEEAIESCKGKTYLVAVSPGPKGGKPGVRSCGQPPE